MPIYMYTLTPAFSLVPGKCVFAPKVLNNSQWSTRIIKLSETGEWSLHI